MKNCSAVTALSMRSAPGMANSKVRPKESWRKQTVEACAHAECEPAVSPPPTPASA